MSMLYHTTNNVGQYGMVVLYWLVIQNFIQSVILKKLIKNMVPEFVAIIPYFTVWCKINKNTNDRYYGWSLNFKYFVNKLIDFYFFHLWWYIFLYSISIVIIITNCNKIIEIRQYHTSKRTQKRSFMLINYYIDICQYSYIIKIQKII